MDSPGATDLEELEHRGWAALCAGNGAAFYGELMTPEALMVLADGSVLDRDAVVASLDQAPPWTSYSLADVRVVPVGEDAAALVYRARAVRPGTDFTALMTSCYVRLDDAWRLAVYQQTVIP
jgi:hypothetical protein